MSASGSGKNDGGLMSSAGLVRYFDSEDNRAIRFDPRSVLAVSLLLAFVLMVAHGVM